MSRHDSSEEPHGRARQYSRDYRDHAGDGSVSLPASGPQPLDFEPASRRNAEQIWDELRRFVELVAAQQSDPAGISAVLDSRLKGSLVCHKSDEREGRKQRETECVKGGPDPARGCD
jgi:hypothetical protein